MMYRQGDVLIVSVSAGTAKPKRPSVVPPEAGRLILARGEATGHHHSVPATCGTLTRDLDTEWALLQLTEPATLVHQEHDPIELPPGDYVVRLQREWTDAMEPRRVAD